MSDRPGAALLWARAVGVGSLAVFLGVAGHATADGLLPGPVVLTVLTLVAVLLCVPLLARPASTLRLVLMMVGGQAVVHVVLTLAAGHVGDRASAAAAMQPGPAGPPGPAGLPEVAGRRVGTFQEAYEASEASVHVGATGPSLPAHLVADLTSHAPMMAAHLAAAAVVGLWLAAGERALWRLLAMTGRRLVISLDLLLVPGPLTPAPLPLRSMLSVRPHARLLLTRPLLRRGPPLVLG